MSTDMRMRCTHCRSIHTGKADFFYELSICPTCQSDASFERLDLPQADVTPNAHSPCSASHKPYRTNTLRSIAVPMGWAVAAAMLCWVIALKYNQSDIMATHTAAEAQWQAERDAMTTVIAKSDASVKRAEQQIAVLSKKVNQQSTASKDNTLGWQSQVIALQDKINDLQAEQQRNAKSELAVNKVFSELKAELTTLKASQIKQLANIETYEAELKAREERIENLSTLLAEKPKRTTPVIQHYGPKRKVVQPTSTYNTLHYTSPRRVIITNGSIVPLNSTQSVISTGGLSVNYDRKTKSSQLGISWGN